MESEIVRLTLPVNNNRDHIQGPTIAPVTLLEYGDYECPYCDQAYVIIKQVQKYLGQKLRFAFRNQFRMIFYGTVGAWILNHATEEFFGRLKLRFVADNEFNANRLAASF